jgi:flagellar hook-associated protein 3 FlgL
MITRVTENIKFNMITNNLFNVASQYGDLMEQLSTQKTINRPSDDPIGTNDILDFRTAISSIDQYKTNITDANVSLSLTETNLSGLRKIAKQATEIAIEESGAGASPETRQASLATLNALIEEALSLLNAKNGDNYLFGGSATDVQPFSSTYAAASVGTASSASTNAFNGTVTSGGTYTGVENKTYVLRVVSGGTLANTTYQVSADGGKNWGGVQTDLSAPVSVGDGITLSFAAGSVNTAAKDTFIVDGHSAGYYQGNNDKLYAVIGKNNNMAYNITGADAFTGQFASAAVVNGGAGIGFDDTIVLTRGATPASWTITTQANYPDMAITSQTTDSLTIDADGDGTDDVTIDLTGAWNQDNTINFSLTAGLTSGEIPATFNGSVGVDVMTTLNALKAALSQTDQSRAESLAAAQVENIRKVETQMLQYETQAGAKMKSLKVTDSNHDAINLQITNMLADIENADLTKLITAFQMKQIAMQASYNMASQIGKMTIMDYI